MMVVFAFRKSNVFQSSGKIFEASKHFVRVHIALGRRTPQKARCHTSSCPGLFSEISNEAVAASDFSHIVSGTSIDLIAFREVTNLPPVTVEEAAGASIADISAPPVPKTINVVHVFSSQCTHIAVVISVPLTSRGRLARHP
jgi:hypothetical protein